MDGYECIWVCVKMHMGMCENAVAYANDCRSKQSPE